MFNRLYQHLLNQEILYPKQLRFQKGNSTTGHVLIRLADQINKVFEKNKYTLAFLYTPQETLVLFYKGK